MDLLKYLKIKVNIIPFSFKPNLKKFPLVGLMNELSVLKTKSLLMLKLIMDIMCSNKR